MDSCKEFTSNTLVAGVVALKFRLRRVALSSGRHCIECGKMLLPQSDKSMLGGAEKT